MPAHPGPSSEAASRRMSVHPRRDSGPELRLRRLVHAAGLRYRVAYPVPGQRRRTIDIAFTRAKVAVFVDGCFWHGCPEHGTSPRSNSAWWRQKIATNQRRDADTTAVLVSQGWTVVRCWEHDDPVDVAEEVRAAVDTASAAVTRRRDSSPQGGEAAPREPGP